MPLHLTPEMLEAAYELLRTTPPFKRWRLPPAEEVEFHVTKHLDLRGDCVDAGHAHVIRISGNCHGSLQKLLETMAHEMCHVRQAINDPDDRAHHGSVFKKYAAQVCRVHGFDPKAF